MFAAEELEEVGTTDDERFGGDFRRDRGGARYVSNQGHFAEILTLSELREVRPAAGDTDLPGEHDVELVALFAFANEYVARGEATAVRNLHHAQEFVQNDKVMIEAELYNASYEPVNTPEASIMLTDESGKDFAYTFSRKGTGYVLEAGVLPPGRYTWKAAATLDGERLAASGEFLVKELVAERLSTVADHALWAGIAARTQGLMTHADDVDRIAEAITSKKSILPRSYAHASFSDLIGLRWIFFVLLALLALEWALRRRSGTY